MKKIILAVFSLSIIIGGLIACSPTDEKNKADTTKTPVVKDEVEEANKEEAPTEKVEEYAASEEELKNAEEEIGEIENEKHLTSAMMRMALQKVKMNESENFEIAGTVPQDRPQFTKGNIAYLKEKAKFVEPDPILVEILNKWSQGEFSDVDKDFAKVRSFLNGSEDDYEMKKRTPEREEEYIKHFYGEEGLKIHEEQWK